MRKKFAEFKIFFLVFLILLSLTGILVNGIHLLRHFYLWPLVRFLGFSALLGYALLMALKPRYNTGHEN